MTSPNHTTPTICVCGDPVCKIPYGTCHCGCGGAVTISTRDRLARGVFAGRPTLRLRGHAKVNNFISANRYTVEDRGYTSPCWIWKECVNAKGYGRISRQSKTSRKSMLAHIALYEQMVGPVPEGKELDHLCRVTLCVNPSHLEAVPHVINMRRGNVAKLTLEKANEIRALHETGMTHKSIASRFGIGKSTVWAILGGITWRE